MSTGPITIFDKSALQSLNQDEAALFGQFYRCNLTPMFFVETLADLEKKVRDGETADPNAHYHSLVLGNLMGADVALDGRPHVVGGRTVENRGKRGVVLEQSAEAEALARWQRHRFLDIERDMAKQWRQSLIDNPIRKGDPARIFGKAKRPRTLEDVKRVAEGFVRQTDVAFDRCLDLLLVPTNYRPAIIKRWLERGQPPLLTFAPYAGYCATVHLSFQLAVSLDLISAERVSNSMDIAYLFYLPFCHVFTSNDKLHSKTAPLFLREDQVFVWGMDLKADLKKLDTHLSALPQEVLDRGLMMLDPPDSADYLTTRLWRRFLPGWNPRRSEPRIAPATEASVIQELREATEAPETPMKLGPDQADFIAIKRSVPVKMGKWRIVAQDIAERSWAAKAAGAAEKASETQTATADSSNDTTE